MSDPRYPYSNIPSGSSYNGGYYRMLDEDERAETGSFNGDAQYSSQHNHTYDRSQQSVDPQDGHWQDALQMDDYLNSRPAPYDTGRNGNDRANVIQGAIDNVDAAFPRNNDNEGRKKRKKHSESKKGKESKGSKGSGREKSGRRDDRHHRDRHSGATRP